MPNPGDPNQPPLSADEAFLALLSDTLDSLERPARGQFLQRFFRSIAHVELNEGQSLEIWDQAQARKRELQEALGKTTSFQAALLDVLAAGNLVRLPILMEFEDLKRLQINAATDPLTGLYNRRLFEEYFEKELNRSIRYSHRLALVIFDLHRFKEVNDRYGHLQGDRLLQAAASTLRKSLRTSDYAFRIGGDEFALLLPQTETEQAAALSKRLRVAYADTIQQMHLDLALALDYGLAVYPDDGDQQEILVRIADERLYQLKNITHTGGRTAAAAATSAAPGTVAAAKALAGPGPQRETTLPGIGEPGAQRRRWERVSLAGTRAYALIGEGVERTARVMDLGYGGVALEAPDAESLEELFDAVLHVPILPPVRVRLRRIYIVPGSSGTSRVGCAFVT